MFDVESFRSKFPLIWGMGERLVYVDNASTTQKPAEVIRAMAGFCESHYANVDYSSYELSNYSSSAHDTIRKNIATYCNVSPEEIIFCSGATEGMNLLAHCYGAVFLSKNDEILIGAAEHHSSCLPWRIVAKKYGCRVRYIPLTRGNYEIDPKAYRSLFSKKTKLVVIQHISNVLGNVNDVQLMAQVAHEYGAHMVIDGAASLAHGMMNLTDIGCDFFVTSGHKCFGPSGSGFIFGRYELLKKMPPYRVGGRMVDKVTFDEIVYKRPPERFEAGSPDILSIVGLGAAIKFLSDIDWAAANNYFYELVSYARDRLSDIPGIALYGSGEAGIFSFNLDGIHAHDVATILATDGIAVRAGHHCAQPLMNILGVNGTVRVSLALYNTKKEIGAIVDSLKICSKYFFK